MLAGTLWSQAERSLLCYPSALRSEVAAGQEEVKAENEAQGIRTVHSGEGGWPWGQAVIPTHFRPPPLPAAPQGPGPESPSVGQKAEPLGHRAH